MGRSMPSRSTIARVHRALLDAGVVILERLNFVHVEPGRYRLVCLPLPVAGLDGTPLPGRPPDRGGNA